MDPVTEAAFGWLTDQVSSRTSRGPEDIAVSEDARDALGRIVESATVHAVRVTIPPEQQGAVLDEVLQEGADQPAAEVAEVERALPEVIRGRLSARFDRLAARGFQVNRDRLVRVLTDRVLWGIGQNAAGGGALQPVAAMLSLPPGPPVPVDPPPDCDDDDEDEDDRL